MKSIARADLSPETTTFLSGRTTKVKSAADPVAEARRLWRQRQNSAFREVREKLNSMATGLERCMYCEDGQGSDIDHFHPRHSHPHLAFDWKNYLLACSICNSNFKRDQFPVDTTGKPLLIDPTVDNPLDHLVFTPQGVVSDLTDKGRSSVAVFALDREILVKGRKVAWHHLGNAIIRYSRAISANDKKKAQEIAILVVQYPFASALVHLLRAARSPNAAAVLDADVISALDRCPEILSWA